MLGTLGLRFYIIALPPIISWVVTLALLIASTPRHLKLKSLSEPHHQGTGTCPTTEYLPSLWLTSAKLDPALSGPASLQSQPGTTLALQVPEVE